MKIYDFMKEQLTVRHLSEGDAKTLMLKVMTDENFAGGTMKDRWGDQVIDYPKIGILMTWEFIRQEALSFIEANYPLAYFKPLFFNEQQLEEYKKANNYDEWLKGKGAKESDELKEETLNIVNKDESYSADYIKKWCVYQIENRMEYLWLAEEIFGMYWGAYAEVQYQPNPAVFYYASYERNYKGFMVARLIRDEEKSPRKRQAVR